MSAPDIPRTDEVHDQADAGGVAEQGATAKRPAGPEPNGDSEAEESVLEGGWEPV